MARALASSLALGACATSVDTGFASEDTSVLSPSQPPPNVPPTPPADAGAAATRSLLGVNDADLSPTGVAALAHALGGSGWAMQVAYSTDFDWAEGLAAGLARARDAGLTPIVRLDYARPRRSAWADGTVTGGATLPPPGDNAWCLVRDDRPAGGALGPTRKGGSHLGCYLDYVEKVLRSPGGDAVHHFVVGNEFNVSEEALAFTAGRIEPAWIATVVRAVRARVRSIPGHGSDSVLLGAVSPGDATTGPKVAGGRTVAGNAMLASVLDALDPNDVDGVTLHAYGGWVRDIDNGGVPAISAFRASLDDQIRVVDASGHTRTPILLGEWSALVHAPTDNPGGSARSEEIPLLAAFISDATALLATRNATAGKHGVFGALYFTWDNVGFPHETLAQFRSLGGTAANDPLAALGAAAKVTPAGDPTHAGTCEAPAPGTQRCFSETGRCMPSVFADVWQSQGGVASFGFPIDDAGCHLDASTGRVLYTQWLQRQRFELHPLSVAPYRVQLAAVGRLLAPATGIDVDAWESCTPGTRVGACECMGPSPQASLGHLVCGELATYWHAHGMSFDANPAVSPTESLALLGLPLSKEVTLKTPSGPLTVQWFERARLERHPESCGAKDGAGLCTGTGYVTAGLLGCAAAGFAPGSRPGC